MTSIAIVNTLLVVGAVLVLAGIVTSLLATRFGAPLLLVFLIIGMLAGEDGPGGIQFNDYQTTYLVGSLSLSIILFDGGLRTKFASLRGVLAPALLLATLGVIITTVLAGALALWVLDLTTVEALLLGSTIASTDAAAVFFLLRTGGLQLRRRVGMVLEVESGTNDPLAAFLTVVLTELLLAHGRETGWAILGSFVVEGAIGTGLGLGAGLAGAWLLNRVALPSGMHPLAVIVGVVLVYGLASIAHGSGFLAVYVAGLIIGNRPIRAYPAIASFHDVATWLGQIVMFLLLGLLVTPSKLLDYALPALAISVFLILVGRPAAVWLCLAPFGFSTREKAFISWVGLRGAVSIFLAAIPTLAAVPNAAVYFNVAFVVVFVSLLVQGWTVTFAARRLGVALRGAAHAVTRVELDLPGQLEQEMIGYPITADSPVLMRHGPLPTWVKPVLVVRNETILNPVEAGPLRVGDYAYFLAPPKRVHWLDQLFATAAEHGHATPATMGEFVLNGDVSLGQLAQLYGLAIPAADQPLSIADLFERRFEGEPQPGDRVPLGSVTLHARQVDADRVVLAGLQLEELGHVAVAAALARRLHAVARFGLTRLQRLLQRLGAGTG